MSLETQMMAWDKLLFVESYEAEYYMKNYVDHYGFLWNNKYCNMSTFFYFEVFMVYILECKQQIRTTK